MRYILNILLLTAAVAPFVMPPNAVVSGVNVEGGWCQNGEMALSYRQTRAQFGAKFSAAGWRHKHSVAIAKDRVVESWERGGETLTFMVWGQAPDKTGFSWGVSQTSTRPIQNKSTVKWKTKEKEQRR